MDDWYKVRAADIVREAGNGPLKLYSGSIAKAISTVYPDYKWQLRKFSSIPHGHWEDIDNRREYMNWVGAELGVKEMSDWYQVKHSAVRKKANYLLTKVYRGSLVRALFDLYKDYPWQIWKFSQVNSKLFTDVSKQRKLFNWVAEDLTLKVL